MGSIDDNTSGGSYAYRWGLPESGYASRTRSTPCCWASMAVACPLRRLAGQAPPRALWCPTAGCLRSAGRPLLAAPKRCRASKAAVNIVNKSLSIDLAPHNCIATLLHPGYVMTGEQAVACGPGCGTQG